MSYVPGMRVFTLSHMVDNGFLTAFLDTRPEVLNWYAVLPGMILVVSRSDLIALTGVIHAVFPWLRFLLCEISSETANGYMSREVWEFVNTPRSSGRWEAL